MLAFMLALWMGKLGDPGAHTAALPGFQGEEGSEGGQVFLETGRRGGQCESLQLVLRLG
eukprot:CAMPEP_0196664052 /NCGR_PEP_ID=MMETSP1086-20130531/55407_1 /TAXON_ID=77921 /ORGANISM="Cyanoptyche  gloeocystis , Strain SAG4.97" /LENGTH=58 /DNA_ID=CAMNT_0042000151 /DNA_START=60 /DNA_END=236 /DNA_ORIENTATION=+